MLGVSVLADEASAGLSSRCLRFAGTWKPLLLFCGFATARLFAALT